jgi:hypothetical protein
MSIENSDPTRRRHLQRACPQPALAVEPALPGHQWRPPPAARGGARKGAGCGSKPACAGLDIPEGLPLLAAARRREATQWGVHTRHVRRHFACADAQPGPLELLLTGVAVVHVPVMKLGAPSVLIRNAPVYRFRVATKCLPNGNRTSLSEITAGIPVTVELSMSR